ncbi:MAG TPA: hypothetical protein VEP66_01465 [Myxococcales bacterium]|nr:hypothetical protein [Myxococcales bacterium]
MTRALWAISIGVLGVLLATGIFRLLHWQGGVFVVLLIWCVGLVAGLVAWFAGIPPPVGAAGGLFGGLLVAVVLAATIAAAPLAPGAQRPGLRDLLWGPLFGLLTVLALCAVAGFYGARAGLFLARRSGRGA